MSYSIDPLTADCYPGTTCLINKLNIRDEAQLAVVEAGITTLKASELSEHPLSGNFDFAHYKAVHTYLFEPLYDWAGQIRTVDMSKKGTHFAKADEIEQMAEAAFSRLKQHRSFAGLPHDDFAREAADFYNVLNLLHPFREGNGRAQRAFFTQLIRSAGYDIQFSEIDTDLLMVATIQAANGVEESLIRLFTTIIHVV